MPSLAVQVATAVPEVPSENRVVTRVSAKVCPRLGVAGEKLGEIAVTAAFGDSCHSPAFGALSAPLGPGVAMKKPILSDGPSSANGTAIVSVAPLNVAVAAGFAVDSPFDRSSVNLSWSEWRTYDSSIPGAPPAFPVAGFASASISRIAAALVHETASAVG